MYRRPDDLDAALRWLADDAPVVLAGGTDVYPARVDRPLPPAVLDLSRIASLRGITHGPAGWRIGATTTWTDLLRADLPPGFDALKQAACEVGGPQVQNRGTIGGNLCNASPAADGVPALLALDAEVELAGPRGPRRLPLAGFVLGPRRTARAADELLVAVHLPAIDTTVRSAFAKLGHRRYLVISIAMVAVAVALDTADRVARVALAVGACGPVACRLAGLEAQLTGTPRATLAERARDALDREPSRWLAPLAPIDDIRGSGEYRLDAVATLLVRALAQAVR